MVKKTYQYSKNYRQKNPWFRPWEYAKRRCNDISHRAYKWYGAIGIKCTLTRMEVIELWRRDQGWLLKEPSIDRLDGKKDYCFENCRFIEAYDNITRRLWDKPLPTEWSD